MRVLVGFLGAVLIALNLAEFFVTLLLPRRVKRGVRLARRAFVMSWVPARALARRLPGPSGDTMLGIYGPIGFLLILVLWTAGLMLGFAMLQWAGGSHVLVHGKGTFLDDLYFSGGAFLSDTTAVAPSSPRVVGCTSSSSRSHHCLHAATSLRFGVLCSRALPLRPRTNLKCFTALVR